MVSSADKDLLEVGIGKDTKQAVVLGLVIRLSDRALGGTWGGAQD